MKTLTILLFSILISFSSYGEWVNVTNNINRTEFYIDNDTIKERNGYVYYWQLDNLIKTDSDGDKSVKRFIKVDCDMARIKNLSVTAYPKSMGLGKPKDYKPNDWEYLSPDSAGAFVINYVCNYVK